MKPSVEIWPKPAALAAALAARVSALAAETVAVRGRFLLAIPGGSAVSLLAWGLAGIPVEASRWEIFWTDERCVPPTDSHSNFRLAQAELFHRLRVPPANLHPADGARGPDEAARAYEAEISKFLESGAPPCFDLVLLGMGEDGHVASLFPGNPALLETKRWVAPVRNAPKPPAERITLTLPVLNQARHVIVVASGAGKAEALAGVFSPDGSPALPARQLHPCDGILRWMLDRAAAAKLKDPP